MKIKSLTRDDLTVGLTFGVICKNCETQLTKKELETKVCPNCQEEILNVNRLYYLVSFLYTMAIVGLILIGIAMGIVMFMPMIFLV